MPVSRYAGTGILKSRRKRRHKFAGREKGMGVEVGNRKIALGLCIGMVISMTGCGAKASGNSDYQLDKAREEARAEVRRHLDESSETDSDERSEDGNARERDKDRDAEEREENRENSEKRDKDRDAAEQENEKKSELARAAAEEALRRDAEDRRRENDERREYEDSHYGERNSDGAFQVDCISFELPEGWEKDDYWSDSYDVVYAPGGDADEAMDCLIISQVTEAFGMVDMFLENMDEMTDMLEEEFAQEEEEYRVTIDDIGMTFLGHTLKMEAFVRDEEESGVVVLYFAEDDSNLYSLYAYTLFDENEDINVDAGMSEQMEEALRMFFDTGRVESRKL